MMSEEYIFQQLEKGDLERRIAAGQLALEMMHEVRNSLEALNNFLYLGLETAGGLEEVRRYIRLAREQATTLKEITSTSLSLARSSRSLRPICLVGLTEAAIRIHRGVIEAKGVQVVKDLPDSLIAEVRASESSRLFRIW